MSISIDSLKPFLIGIGITAVAVLAIFYMHTGARARLSGNILKVRTAPLDENSAVAVVDFRFRNTSDVVFGVATVTVILEEKDGKQYPGGTISESDTGPLFSGLPLLGQKFNQTLVMRDKIGPGESADRMVAARFEAPEARLENRKRLIVRIEDTEGEVSELAEVR